MIYLDGLINIRIGFGQIAILYFWLFFSISRFHLVFVVTSKIKLILFLIAVILNGRKFDMLMYPDHLENWLDFGHRLLIFLVLAAFWFSETGQICDFWSFSWEHMEEWPQICMLMYSDHLQNRFDFGHALLIFLIFAPFWLSETGQIWGFLDFL